MNSYVNNRNKYLSSGVNNATYIAKRGIITGFDPLTWMISITYYPLSSEEGYDAGAIQAPLGTQWVGNGWGLCLAPITGTEVEVLFESGNLHTPVSVCSIFNNENPPISGVKSGEAWLKHESGSLIKLTEDGQVTISSTVQLNLVAPIISATATTRITLQAPIIQEIATTSITHQAPIINETGNVVVTGTLTTGDGSFVMNDGGFTTTKSISTTQDVLASGVSLKTHKHGGVQAGGDETGEPV